MHQDMDADAVDAVMAEPEVGIDVAKLKADTILIVETSKWMYQLVLHDPSLCTVMVESGDHCFEGPALGQYQGAVVTKTKMRPRWIGKGMPMSIRFRNDVYVSEPVQSVVVCGKGWEYEVF